MNNTFANKSPVIKKLAKENSYKQTVNNFVSLESFFNAYT